MTKVSPWTLRLTFRSPRRPPFTASYAQMSAAREIEDIQRQLVRHQHDHPPVRDLNRESDRRLTASQRIGEDFARLVGSWTFVVIQVVLTLAWLGLNALALVNHWDPYPFQLL